MLSLTQKLSAHNNLWQNVARVGDCWMWTGATLNSGYGSLHTYYDNTAHRVAYKLIKGEIPNRFDLDHTCHDPKTCPGGKACPHRRCVNPAHLEPVSRHENIMRGAGPQATRTLRAAVTHCPEGHPYDEKNTYHHPQGSRNCRECSRIRMQKRRDRGKLA